VLPRDKPGTAFGPMNTDILEATVPGYVPAQLPRPHSRLAFRHVIGIMVA
jgi:hypothetical protein